MDDCWCFGRVSIITNVDLMATGKYYNGYQVIDFN